jgi:hypothetical protein
MADTPVKELLQRIVLEPAPQSGTQTHNIQSATIEQVLRALAGGKTADYAAGLDPYVPRDIDYATDVYASLVLASSIG